MLAKSREPRPEQVPHLLVIEHIDFDDVSESELHVECPLDHVAQTHWCTSIYISPRLAFQLPGCKVTVGFRTIVECWVLADVAETGPFDMLGALDPHSIDASAWPDHLPQQPGSYPVRWACDGRGEDFTSWLELVE